MSAKPHKHSYQKYFINPLDYQQDSAYSSTVKSKRLTRDQVIALLKQRQGDRYASELAHELGISEAYLSDIYLGKRDPGPSVLTHLGIAKRIIRSSTVEYEAS